MANESLQDQFLNEVRKERQLVTVFLMNGRKPPVNRKESR